MLKNYLKIAFRSLHRHRAYAAITIAGLAVGMAACLLLVYYVQDELSYDRFHDAAEGIYRVASDRSYPNDRSQSALTPRSLAEALVQEGPAVVAATRLSREHADQVLVEHGDTRYFEQGVVFADANVFDVFTLPLVRGNPQTALRDPYTLVVTEAMALKYFGDEDPLGQVLTLRLQGDGDRFDYRVTGVARALPPQSHFQFDFLASYQLHPFTTTDGLERVSWLGGDVYTYVLLREGATAAEVEASFETLVETYAYPTIEAVFEMSVEAFLAAGNGFRYFLQPLTDIHLYSQLDDEIAPTGDILYVYLFATIALFILLTACINFMNLTTARSARRAREVGVRKALGSYQTQLVQQFLTESVLLSFLALPLALALVEVVLPVFNALSAKQLASFYMGDGLAVGGLVVFAVLVGLLAGCYPAFVLAQFRPAVVLKGGQQGTLLQGTSFRNGLVVFQFAISILLIIGTVVIYAQMDYMRTKKLGFAEEEVVVVEGAEVLKRQTDTFKQAVEGYGGVLSTASSEAVPGGAFRTSLFEVEGRDEGQPVSMTTIFAGFGYVETLGLEVVQGRSLSAAFAVDSLGALINERAAQTLGLVDPLGHRLVWNDQVYPIVGVVRDFHFASLHREIGPLVLLGPDPEFENRPRQFLSVRIQTDDVARVLASLEDTWGAFIAHQPFTYSFLDEDLETLYGAEQATGRLIGVFAGLTIIIASLGLFGLAAFITEQRTKEIGVRKALGATVPQIVLLLSRDFTRLVVIAFVIAAPIAYLVMQTWLEDFYYRIELGVGVFLLAGGVALLVAWLTVSYQSIKAALTEPIHSLRYE